MKDNRFNRLLTADREIFDAINKEAKRQKEGVELIASENYVSEAVLEAIGSILTNKYSEGYPAHRYYGGNEFIDEVETLAIERAKKLFNASFVNVQPYSGSPANMAVHFAFLNPGDNTMGMDLRAGGHLTHGFKVTMSGRHYNSVSYGVDEKGYIDYEQIMKLAKEHKPKMIWCGASAYSRVIDFKRFREVADEVGAILVADMAHIAGLVAAGVHESPIGIADVVTTTTHKTLRGPRGAMILTNNEEMAVKIDKAIFPGMQGGPHNHTTAGIAVALGEALQPDFKEYAEQIVKNASKLADELMKKGYKIISDGTDNHLMLLDVTAIDAELSGGEAESSLELANITLNKNAIPNDPRKPTDPSGVRIGTPAITTRGLKEKDMVTLAGFIDRVLQNYRSNDVLEQVKSEVVEWISPFEIPGI
ncbi:MAG: serine hydroxymethyltransferase [Candidatus Dojkabacteria bacterium]